MDMVCVNDMHWNEWICISSGGCLQLALMRRQLITNGLLVYFVMVWCNLIRGEIEREMGITLGVDI